MSKRLSIVIIIISAILSVMVMNAVSQELSDEKGDGLADTIKKDKKLRLTINKVIDYLIKNNLDVQATLIEHKGLSSGLRKFKGKYDATLFGSADYSYSKNPNPASSILYGEYSEKKTYKVGVKKQLDTGTTLEVALNGYSQKVQGAMFGQTGNQSGVTVTLTQELLKNAFGIDDRLTEKKIANTAVKGKHLTKVKLSGLLMQALIGYWQIAIAEENLATMDISVKSAVDIRNLIADKARLGLSEAEDVQDWNNKVLQLKNAREQADQFLFEARLALLRTLNLESDLVIELGQTFNTNQPKIAEEEALRDAMLKRMDLYGQKGAGKPALGTEAQKAVTDMMMSAQTAGVKADNPALQQFLGQSQEALSGLPPERLQVAYSDMMRQFRSTLGIPEMRAQYSYQPEYKKPGLIAGMTGYGY